MPNEMCVPFRVATASPIETFKSPFVEMGVPMGPEVRSTLKHQAACYDRVFELSHHYVLVGASPGPPDRRRPCCIL